MDSDTRHIMDLERMLLDGSVEPTYLPLSLLEDITKRFSDDQKIGSGGFAVVYKGVVGKGMVAVKKLSKTMHENKFHKEVECLMKAKHKNIVRFPGYCSDTQGRFLDYEGKFIMADLRNWLLCFEYVPNGSLDKYIADASCGLEWGERYQLIKGICNGLLHLHERRILHLDLKPSNILVDDFMVPKIADFGLSRCLGEKQTRDFTSNLYGSLGYLAPEFYRGEVAFASDIYSLGVVIVEILTGVKGYPEIENVVEIWMNRLEVSDQLDTELEQIRVCAKIGIECMDVDPKKRPIARHIIDRLDQTESTFETGISSSSAELEEQVSFLEEQHGQEKLANLSSEYLQEDIKENTKTEELAEYIETPREDHWQQGEGEAPGDQLSLWGAQDMKPGLLKLFEKEELKEILRYSNFIGKDGFGEVYQGLVRNVLVTVRMLIGGTDIQKERFAKEVIIQSEVDHKNIVRIIGCCLEVDDQILVYEFFYKGNLEHILHSNDKVPLNLGTRLSIAAASADGLAYMHSMANSGILHGDFKPANILLDENSVLKISDFGMSRMTSRDIIGDIAYMDPVYLQTGLLTDKSDVYSFGVVILELLTRKKATRSGNNILVKNFLRNHKQRRNSSELFDKEIALKGDLELLDNVAGVAVECLNLDVDLRPTMIDVADRLSALNRSRML